MKRLLLALLCISPLHAMELIEAKNISSADQALRLYTNHKDIFVEGENAAYRVERHAMNKELRDVLEHKALNKFKDAGYIRINKVEDGKYALAAKVRGKGGGPIAGCIAYWLTKSLMYGTAIAAGTAAVTTAVVATGGSAGGVMVGTAILGTAKAGAGLTAGVIASGITAGGGTTIATTATAGVLVSTGSIAGAAAFVEASAGAAGCFFLSLPIP